MEMHLTATHITEDLLDALLSEKSLKEILDFSYNFLQNPILIFGKKAQMICFSSKLNIDDYIHAPLSFGARNADRKEFISTLQDDFTELTNGDEPVLTERGFCFNGKRRLVMGLTSGSDWVATVVLVELNRLLTDEDRVHLIIIGRAISRKLSASGFQNDFYDLYCEQNIIDLLKGNQINIRNSGWFPSFNKNLQQNYMIAVLNTIEYSTRQYEKLKVFINRRLFNFPVVKYGSDTVILANFINKNDFIAFQNILTELVQRFSLQVGVSDVFSDIHELKSYYEQAVEVRKCGCLIEAADIIHEFSKLKPYILLGKIAEHIPLSHFISRHQTFLMKYDANENTEYWKTLLTYIRYGKSRQKACEILTIHKNTLAYRLDKIAELLNCTLNDGDFLFDIRFSSIICDILKVTSRQEEQSIVNEDED